MKFMDIKFKNIALARQFAWAMCRFWNKKTDREILDLNNLDTIVFTHMTPSEIRKVKGIGNVNFQNAVDGMARVGISLAEDIEAKPIRSAKLEERSQSEAVKVARMVADRCVAEMGQPHQSAAQISAWFTLYNEAMKCLSNDAPKPKSVPKGW